MLSPWVTLLGLVIKYRAVTMRNFGLLQNTPFAVSEEQEICCTESKFSELKFHSSEISLTQTIQDQEILFVVVLKVCLCCTPCSSTDVEWCQAVILVRWRSVIRADSAKIPTQNRF